jgi:hypothetical protein
MKSYLPYSSFIAIGNAVITLVLYLAGFHTDPAKLQTANYIAGAAGLALGIGFLVVGIRAKRALVPATEEFSYGMALGSGVLISLFAVLFGAAFQFIYQSFINPGFADVLIQAQAIQLEAKGIPSDQIEKIAQFTRMMTKPAVQAVIGIIGGMIFSVIICLIAAALLKRKAVETPLT